MADLRIVESRTGNWHYHLSDHLDGLVALCGTKTMHSYAPLDSWGFVGHLGERYCAECRRLADSAAALDVQEKTDV